MTVIFKGIVFVLSYLMKAETIYEQKKFWFKLKLSFFIISSWWFVEFLQFVFNLSFNSFGLSPKKIDKLYGIFTYPFLHGDIEHLTNNTISAFIIFSALFLIYEKISFNVILIIYIFSGLMLWLIGENGSTHIGASSIIYGVAFFLFLSGMIIRESSTLALSLFMVLWYGSMIWGLTPFTVEDGVSWEGHLSGALVGSFLAFWYFGKEINKKPLHIEDEDDFFFFDKFPIE